MALSTVETQLKLLHSQKNRIFARIQSIYDKSFLLDDASSKETFLYSLEYLDSLRLDFENILNKINTLELNSSADYIANYDALTPFEDLLGRIRYVERSLKSPCNTKQELTSSNQINRDRPKLPAIQIPEFSGNIRDWSLFYNSFENTIHNNDSLTDHEKLYYLVSKLTGKAKAVLVGITLCPENYSLILNTLKVKYEDRRLVATAYLDQLFELKNIAACNEQNLERFLDIFANSVRAIKNLKVSDLSDFLFLYIGLKKLDLETVRLFELTQRGNELPSFNDLEAFIRDHIKVLQRTCVRTQNIVKNSINSERRLEKPSHTQRFTQAYLNTSTLSRPPPRLVCLLCNDRHNQLYKCAAFLNLTPNERYKYVRANNLCLNCLSDKHNISQCNSKQNCITCGKRHHSSLHFNISSSRKDSSHHDSHSSGNANAQVVQAPLPAGSSLLPSPRPANDVALCSFAPSRIASTVLLATARVVVFDANGRAHSVRALIDNASQSNFITARCCQRLNLNVENSSGGPTVKGIGGTTKSVQGFVNVRFHPRNNLNISFNVNAIVVDKVTEKLPTVSVDTSLLFHFKNLVLADDTYDVPGDIDMLIGASLFPHLLLTRRVQGHPSQPAPFALETVLGYIIIGSAPALTNNYSSISYCCTVEPLESAVRRFWEIDEVDVPTSLSPDDKEAEEIYSRTTVRDSNGRYIVSLPFKGDVFSLGDSRQVAERRFLCLERKLQAQPKLKQAYDDVIREYLDKGYISPVSDSERDSPSYIIPHLGVIREDKLTTKFRMVLDASSKTSTSVSLNDILYSGPNLQGNLFDIIVNFRLFSIALSADIRQMFLGIGIHESDRKFQRIFYRFTPNEPLKLYEFTRVCFGLKSSPFHALRTVKQLAKDEGSSYPKAQATIETGLYMDDFVYSVENEVEAIETSSQVISLMKAGQFDLVKWISNSQKVLDSIPSSHRLSTVKSFSDDDSHKILGLTWSSTSDIFSIKITSTPQMCTKRIILSCVARIWDIMGFVAPVVLYAKLLIKELWLSGCDWDDTPPIHIAKFWSRFREELPVLNQIQIPRHVGITPDSIITLVGFGDASQKAFGGVVYFHVQKGNTIRVSLITAKSKVSPSRVVSLARLELSAMLLLVRVINKVESACRHRINISKVFAFSDSTVALCWAHSSPHRWDTFVANRVTKIQAGLSPQNLYHVTGSENPADCLSRGLTPAQILNHPLWFRGPSWIHAPQDQWPIKPFNPATVSEPPEEKKHIFVSTESSKSSIILLLANRLSSWSQLLRCVVYVCRFVKILPIHKYITATDLDKAELIVLRELQRSHFAIEFRNLELNKPCSRAFQRLKPFLEDGLLRVGGRLSQSSLGFEQRHPIVLPRKHHVLDLLVDYYHRVNCHAGPELLMSILRQKYWILSARNLIRSRVFKCLSCFKLRPRSYAPEMADHRSCRVVETVKPFVHVGTDYCGPFKVSMSRGRGIRATKAYVCLFVCMTTRAVHIELASDLSTPSFLSAFKRFLSRRGPISRVYSDNGSNYVGARRYLTEIHAFLRSKHFHSEFAHVLAENRIEWHLNTPAASHFGGNWEANIKSLKSHLYRVIGEQILSFEEFCTVLAQIEAVMNTRPLCRTLSSDPSESLALTPAHFLNMTPLKYIPARDVDENRLHLLSRQDLLDKLVQSFWKRWKVDYLHTLQTRQKWNTPSNPIKVGTVVIIRTDNAPTLHWPLGLVEEVFPGSNGVVRVARVKTASGSYLRPVIRLCPLPSQ